MVSISSEKQKVRPTVDVTRGYRTGLSAQRRVQVITAHSLGTVIQWYQRGESESIHLILIGKPSFEEHRLSFKMYLLSIPM
jgi:hypothetical protein